MMIKIGSIVGLLLASTLAFAANQAESSATEKQMPVGGYQAVPAQDAEVHQAAQFAVKQKSTARKKYRLLRVISAQTQVVAGVNYQLCLAIKDPFKHGVRNTQVTVYRNLQNHYQLTNWQWDAC